MSTSPIQPPRAHSSDPMAPQRFVEGGGTDYERRLFEAAGRDAPPPASCERVAAALKAAALAPSFPEPRAGNPGLSHNAAASAFAKPWVLGVIGAGIIGALVARGGSSESSDVPAPMTVPVTAPTPVSFEPSMPAPRAAPSVDVDVASARSAAELDSAQGPERREPAARARAKVPLPPPTSKQREPAPKVDLAAEVRAIETIQTLLGWGQTEQAASGLDDYRQRFPNGELRLEADLLNIDIAIASGQREEASRLARALLERPGASRYRERLNAVLDAPKSSGSIRAPR